MEEGSRVPTITKADIIKLVWLGQVLAVADYVHSKEKTEDSAKAAEKALAEYVAFERVVF